ncbi:MAG: ABC transporter permease [Spirochaetaceae bacterium]|jgi:simple sugar transport system permease protein|nr:ABC transporter permease [Spirochaetaceae bacterium]
MIDSIALAAGPLLLASLAALYTELSGALGVFIEGFMNIGAFFAYLFTVKTGSVLIACLLTGALAGSIGFALACFVRSTGANPFIAGLALNLFAEGLTASLSAAFFGTKGVLRSPDFPPTDRFSCVYLALSLLLATAFVVKKTVLGPRLIASGTAPSAAYERGIHTQRYRVAAWTAAAIVSAAAGAHLTFRVSVYTPGGVAGRGWIALACVYLGFRRIGGTAAAALLFAVVEYIGYSVQVIGAVSATLVLGLPSALALMLYALSCAGSQMRKPVSS